MKLKKVVIPLKERVRKSTPLSLVLKVPEGLHVIADRQRIGGNTIVNISFIGEGIEDALALRVIVYPRSYRIEEYSPWRKAKEMGGSYEIVPIAAWMLQ